MVVRVADRFGLHARLAAKIIKVAQQARSTVWIRKADDKVDAASLLDVLTIACPHGSYLTIEIDHLADMDIMARIADLIATDTGE
jgi:phosphocarrier protein